MVAPELLITLAVSVLPLTVNSAKLYDLLYVTMSGWPEAGVYCGAAAAAHGEFHNAVHHGTRIVMVMSG